MNLTVKETNLLNDFKTQEQICIEKYGKYAADARDPQLKELFDELRGAEENHLSVICRIIGGEEVSLPAESPSAASQKFVGAASSCSEDEKKSDAFLCKDALSMEKHVSSVYDTGLFEFCSTTVRDTLAHIQKEEQNHGEKLYSYMAKNGMYA